MPCPEVKIERLRPAGGKTERGLSMKGWKKVTAILAAALLLASCGAALAKTEDFREADRPQWYAEYLAALCILDQEETAAFGSEEEISRGEMAKLLVTALGYERQAAVSGGGEQFPDYDPENPYAREIGLCAQLGILSGDGDGQIKADRPVTATQAAKMLVAALGYGIYAENQGGYPSGYLLQAGQLRLLRGVPAREGNAFTKKDAAAMLYNALDVPVLKLVGISEKEVYEKNKNDTLKTQYLDAKDWYMGKGVVEGNRETSIAGDMRIKEGKVVISGELFAAGGTRAADYLGYRVEFVAKNPDGADGNQLVGVVRTMDNVAVSLSHRDDLSLEGTALGYYENGKKQELKINPNAALIRNHKLAEGFNLSERDLAGGEFLLLDNDHDELYDVIIIRSSVSFLVERVSAENEKIYLKAGSFGQNVIDMKPEEDKIITARELDGSALDWTRLQNGEAISLIASEDGAYLELIRLGRAVTGKVEAVFPEGRRLRVSGKEYGYAAQLEPPAVGQTGDFYLNEEGEAFYFEEKIDTYAYVMAKGNGGGVDVQPQVKLYTLYEGVRILDLADSVRVNEENYRTQAALQNIRVGALATYSLNAAGQLKSLKDAEEYGALGERLYRKTANGFNNPSEFQMTPIKLNGDTQIFCVPRNGNDEDFGAAVKFEDGDSYQIQGFDYDKDTKEVGALVVQVDTDAQNSASLTYRSPVGIISKITTGLDAEEQGTYLVEGYSEGKPFRYTARQDQKLFDRLAAMRTGDIIRFETNYIDEMVNVERLMNLSENTNMFHMNKDGENEQVIGNILKLDKEVMTNYSEFLLHQLDVSPVGSYQEWSTLRIYAMRENPKDDQQQFADYYIFDKAAKSVKPASIDDVVTVEQSASAASKVFMQRTNTVVKMFVIIKE